MSLKNRPHQKVSMNMHYSVTVSKVIYISKYGCFWHFLATFGIENGPMITLSIFDDLKFAENMCHIRVHNIKLIITKTHKVIFHILKIC